MKKGFHLVGQIKPVSFCAIALVVLLFSSCASTKPNEQQSKQPMAEHSSIIEVSGATKDELWLRANEWCIDAFKNSTSVVQYSDKEAGVLRGKFTNEYNGYYYEYVQTTFSIEVKDEKARLIFYDPLRVILGDIMFGGYSSPKEIPVYESDEKLVQNVQSDWILLEATFSATLRQKNNDDW